MKPVQDRLEQQEVANKKLFEQVKELEKEVEILKAELKSGPVFPVLQTPSRERSRNDRGLEENNYQKRVEEMCAAGRRIIGFSPIEPRMIELQMQSYGAQNQEEAMQMEVKSYLKCELKLKPSEIENLDIVRIFPPAKESWNVLYVEFGSESQVDKVMACTRVLVKKDHRVVRWFPKQMYDRYRAVESLAYNMRKNLNHKTRVKIGKCDIELSSRETGSIYWKRHLLPNNLPEINMDIVSGVPLSPPPGRPWRAVTNDDQENVSVTESCM